MKDFKNDLLKRREIGLVMDSASNPGFSQAGKMIADQFKVSADTVVVHNVKGKFGRDTFLIKAFIYDSVKDKEMVEPKPRVKKADAGGAK